MLIKPPNSYDLCGQASQFHVYLLCLKACLAKCLKIFLIVKALVGAFNKEKALVCRGLLLETVYYLLHLNYVSVFRCKYPPLHAKLLNRGGGRWSGRVAWLRWPPPVKRADKSSSRMHAALLFLPRNKSTDGPRRITLFILNRGLAKRNTRPQIFNQVSIQN